MQISEGSLWIWPNAFGVPFMPLFSVCPSSRTSTTWRCGRITKGISREIPICIDKSSITHAAAFSTTAIPSSPKRHIILHTCCYRDHNEGFNSVFECRSNEDYAFAFRQWMNIGQRRTTGERWTVDHWLSMQQPWRLEDRSVLKKTEEIVKQEELWLTRPTLPIVEVGDLDERLPSWKQTTVG